MAKPPSSSRRDFLKGQAALDALSHAGETLSGDGVASGDGSRGGKREESFLIQLGRKAMACQFEVFLNAGEFPGAEERVVEALDLVDQLEQQLTVFRDTSEVSQLNQRAAAEPVVVEKELFELLRRARALSESTNGAFDITSGQLTKLWGFHRREGRLPSDDDITATLANVGGQLIDLDEETRTVTFQQEGVEINLGAIGKGFALDRAARHLRTWGVSSFLFHGGKSSILACGSRTNAKERQGWTVAVRHPLRPDRNFIEVRLVDQALATSGSGAQFFHHQGRRLGHILDPRTGRPAENVLSATVIAPTAEQADALSTAFYVMGAETSLDYCRQRPDLGVAMVVAGERQGSVEILIEGLEEDRFRLLEVESRRGRSTD